jgi:protein-L-isoaspartate O-methyltransferase
VTDRELIEEYERWFRENPDPWNFETSPYEIAKRAATIEACEITGRTRVLELGAANGVLAADLAGVAGEVVAVEGVAAAAALARERLEPYPDARVVEGMIPADVPTGPYDLIVASEILYYLDEPSYRATLAALPTWLAPGGRLVAVHWRPSTPERPRSADDVHTDLDALPHLRHVLDRRTADYRLDVFQWNS